MTRRASFATWMTFCVAWFPIVLATAAFILGMLAVGLWSPTVPFAAKLLTPVGFAAIWLEWYVFIWVLDWTGA